MKEMFIYRGLPGSGKTTRAKQLQKNTGGVLAGRDHIREMLFGGYKNGEAPDSELEKRVTEIQDTLIREGLRSDNKVIVDDMNIRKKYVKRLMDIAHEEGALCSFIDLSDVDPADCMYRDAKRERTVGAEVIDDLYKRFVKGKGHPLPVPELPRVEDEVEPYVVPQGISRSAIIVDIDGTVAHNDHRGWYDYEKVIDDKPKETVIRAVRNYANKGYEVLFVSGRQDYCYADTMSWLCNHVFPPHQLWMRKSGDRRSDFIVKREIFDQHIRRNYHVEVVFDDRDQVVQMWRSLGLTCFQVENGAF